MSANPLAGLGRLYIPDTRDHDFPMATPLRRPQRTFRNWLVPGGAHDQGDTAQCVAYACEAWLRAHPVVNAHRVETEIDKKMLYREAQRIDEWPGENYDGTSVRAGFAVLQRRGFVGRYSWAWDAETVAKHMLEIGPVVVGTEWFEAMFTPDRYGYIAPYGPSYGGHAYLLVGVNARRVNPDKTIGAFRIQNSWGPGWGEKGRAWISIAHMDVLIQDHGEACTAHELRLRA